MFGGGKAVVWEHPRWCQAPFPTALAYRGVGTADGFQALWSTFPNLDYDTTGSPKPGFLWGDHFGHARFQYHKVGITPSDQTECIGLQYEPCAGYMQGFRSNGQDAEAHYLFEPKNVSCLLTQPCNAIRQARVPV